MGYFSPRADNPNDFESDQGPQTKKSIHDMAHQHGHVGFGLAQLGSAEPCRAIYW